MTRDLTDEETRALLNLFQDHATLWSSRSIGRQSTRWHGTPHWRCFPEVCHRGPRRNSAAQIRVGKDEIDRLILRTECGRAML